MYRKNHRRLTKALSAFMAAALVFTSFPSEAKTSKKKEVTQIQLTSPYSAAGKKTATTLTLKKGSTFKIRASVSPKSASKKLVYKSSKNKIASVSKSGKIKAKKVGKATITVQPKSNKKVKATIRLTVVDKLKKVKKIALDQSSLSLSVNSTAQLTASVVSPKKPTSKKFNWFTSDASVAVVSKKGMVTAKATGNANIMATSADGQGAKAVCRVTVTEGDTPVPTAVPTAAPTAASSPAPGGQTGGTPANSPDVSPSAPDNSPSVPASELTVVIPGGRIGIKQGESIQLTAEGPGAEQAAWSVSGASGVTISENGLLTVPYAAEAGKKLQIKLQTSADVAVKSASASLTVVENQILPLTEDQIKLNQSTAENPTGLTYRDPEAYSIVTDPERGSVVRFDASKGYTSNANDVLAWMVVDPAYAGKVVAISAYMKYEPSEDIVGDMNLVINENWRHSNPARQYNAKADTWYYISGTYKMPSNLDNYNVASNRLYICRDMDTAHLSAGKNAVYYIDSITFTVMDSEVEGVTVSTKDDKTEVYPGETLQCSAKVTGKNDPSQRVTYSVDPAVEGVSIDENGLLTVGNAAAGEITVKATSVENPAKSGTVKVTVLAQSVDSVKITAAGKVTKIYPNSKLQLSADVKTSGKPETKVTWKVNPELSGVSIDENGLLKVTEQEEGTVITVEATASVVSNPAIAKTSTYNVTVLGDFVEPYEVKAIKANQWDAFTDDYYCNLKYDEEEGSCYYENGETALATGDENACVGFLINPDGSAFDASYYNTLTIYLECDVAEGLTSSGKERTKTDCILRVYSATDNGYSKKVFSYSEFKSAAPITNAKARVWRVPLNDLVTEGVDLTNMKALSIETNGAFYQEGIKIHSFTFENLSDYEPYWVSVTHPDYEEKVREGKSLPLTAKALNKESEEIGNINFSWSSSDETVATVSEDGVVTGVSAGKATISAAAAGSKATGYYTVTVYDSTPVGVAVKVGDHVYDRNGGTNRIDVTEEELAEGIPLKMMQVDAGNEVVGESPDLPNATISSTSKCTASYENGILTAALNDGEKSGTISMKIPDSNKKNISFYFMICKGHRIPLDSTTIYNASVGKQKDDITFSPGYATIAASTESASAIGFKYALPDGEKLSKYKTVNARFVKADGEYSFSLYMPLNGWDAESITCTEADSKLASSTSSTTTSKYKNSENEFTLSLTAEEADTGLAHFAFGFGEGCTGDLSIQSLILVEE
ncbi:MAG: Ig-like domain-containing protein [Roseburia sp.]|nr:Ig-like domain-containing protein [Roseburia sp.]